MSPVSLLKTPLAASVHPFGSGGGFTVLYSRCDRPTLSAIRNYQSLVTSHYPGWMTRFDFDPQQKNCKLQVFPIGDAALASFGRYGW
jgi:hypothetical protein